MTMSAVYQIWVSVGARITAAADLPTPTPARPRPTSTWPSSRRRWRRWNAYNPWANTPADFGAPDQPTMPVRGRRLWPGRTSFQPSRCGRAEPQRQRFRHRGGAVQPLRRRWRPPVVRPQQIPVAEQGRVGGRSGSVAALQPVRGKSEGRAGHIGRFQYWRLSGGEPGRRRLRAWTQQRTGFSYGQKEGRQGSGFEPWLGAANTPAQPQQQQWAHTPDWDQYFNTATAPDADQSRNALAAEYYLANPDVYKAAQQAGGDKTAYGLNHLMAFGQDEGRTFFRRATSTVRKPGCYRRRDGPDGALVSVRLRKRAAPLPQSSVFNKETYNLLNPDVAAAGMDPLRHWLDFGQKENRMGGAFESAQSYCDLSRDDIPGPVDSFNPRGAQDCRDGQRSQEPVRRSTAGTRRRWPL